MPLHFLRLAITCFIRIIIYLLIYLLWIHHASNWTILLPPLMPFQIVLLCSLWFCPSNCALDWFWKSWEFEQAFRCLVFSCFYFVVCFLHWSLQLLWPSVQFFRNGPQYCLWPPGIQILAYRGKQWHQQLCRLSYSSKINYNHSVKYKLDIYKLYEPFRYHL